MELLPSEHYEADFANPMMSAGLSSKIDKSARIFSVTVSRRRKRSEYGSRLKGNAQIMDKICFKAMIHQTGLRTAPFTEYICTKEKPGYF